MDKLSTTQIFNKTFKYVVLRMAIPIVSAVLSVVAIKVITGIVAGDAGNKMGPISTLIWFVITFGIYFGLNFFLGFKFRSGQMAVITDAVSVNMIPDDIGKLAKESTEYRFPSGNEYFAYRVAVMRSIRQLQMELNTFAENKLRVPVLGGLIRFCQFVIGHALSFTYDLVLCYTFWRDGKTLFASAADGIAVYWDCWKRISANVMFLAIELIVGYGVGTAFVGVIFATILSPTSGPLAGGLCGLSVGYFVATAVKVVIDTNLTLKTLNAFFEEGQYADYNSEEYENMCRYSKAYSKLYQKALNEAFAVPDGGYGNDYVDDFTSNYNPQDYADDPGSYGSDFIDDYNNGYGNDQGYANDYNDYSDDFVNDYGNDGYGNDGYGNDGYGYDNGGADNGGYGNDYGNGYGADNGGYGNDYGNGYGTGNGGYSDDYGNNYGGSYGNYGQ